MNGLYVPAATCMIEATSSATSVAVATSDALRATAGRRATANRAASAGTHGVEPTAPAASASHTSDVRYHRTVYVFDTRTGQVLAKIPVGAEDHGLTYFPNVGAYSIGHNGVYR